MQSMPDITALIRIAQSPAGQKLLTMLQASDPAALRSITEAAATGNWEAAKQTISGLLSSNETRELLKQLENQL